jgi:hypothetical protein
VAWVVTAASAKSEPTDTQEWARTSLGQVDRLLHPSGPKAAVAAALAKAGRLEEATGKLTDDLSNLQTSVDVLNAISSALAIIASIAALAA